MNIEKYPISKLSKERERHVDEVVRESSEKIQIVSKDISHLEESVATTVYQERIRIKQERWKADPDDDFEYWGRIKNQLLLASSLDNDQIALKKEKLQVLTDSILRRYTEEITGKFSPSTYGLATRLVPFGFNFFLNAASRGLMKQLFGAGQDLSDRIRLEGETEQFKEISEKGTVVLLPTHSSNLDSIVIGWALHQLGLPPFMYGAGLNLFSYPVFGWFMNRLGAYKVDRRKKNPLYLNTLKTYSTHVLENRCHSLFFPGGGRSRSGGIEDHLKLGLLGTAFEAQRRNYSQLSSNTDFADGKKIFIVPMVMSYHFILEANSLITEHLRRQGREKFFLSQDEFSSISKGLIFLWKFFSAQSHVILNFGKPMDLFGNFVDSDGRSLDQSGKQLDTRDYFKSGGEISADLQRDSEYCRMLGAKVSERYFKENMVLSSHLVAWSAFELMKKRFPFSDLYGFLRTPLEDRELGFTDFLKYTGRVREKLKQLSDAGKIKLSSGVTGDLEHVVRHGVRHLGLYHSKRPLIIKNDSVINSENLSLLLFYRNRLDGYGLEKVD